MPLIDLVTAYLAQTSAQLIIPDPKIILRAPVPGFRTTFVDHHYVPPDLTLRISYVVNLNQTTPDHEIEDSFKHWDAVAEKRVLEINKVLDGVVVEMGMHKYTPSHLERATLPARIDIAGRVTFRTKVGNVKESTIVTATSDLPDITRLLPPYATGLKSEQAGSLYEEVNVFVR